MEDTDLKSLWAAGKRTHAVSPWTTEQIESFRETRSRSVVSDLVRRLRFDLVLKGLAALAFAAALALPWDDGLGWVVSGVALLFTLLLAWPTTTALHRLGRHRNLTADVRSASVALLAEIRRFRRGALPSLAATSSLLPLAYALVYSALEHGALRANRPIQVIVFAALGVLPFLATWWVVEARMGASGKALAACLAELDPDALAEIRTADRRAGLVLLVAVALVALFLAAGVILLLAG